MRRDGATGGWEHHASWWQQHFTGGVDPEYEEQILPLAAEVLAGAGRVLDVGCGEGQVARRLARGGSMVVGVDPAWAQVVVAAARGGGPRYIQGRADRLPVASGAFDGVVVCLVLEHIDDLDAAVAEISRVLVPGGRLALFLNHPLLQTPGAAWVVDHTVDPVERSWRIGAYLEEAAFEDEVEKGVRIRFVHRPLGRYVNALVAAGLQLTGMREPSPPEGFLNQAPEYREQAAIPRLLLLEARRLAGR